MCWLDREMIEPKESGPKRNVGSPGRNRKGAADDEGRIKIVGLTEKEE